MPDIQWDQVLIVGLQVVTAIIARLNHKRIGQLHDCVDNAKRSADFHTDIVVDMLKEIAADIHSKK
ncbi:MAG: hypothetical protein H0X31_00870 [Nostocaceae cyanobacterium]|nr:hypothetical protein [Nostocaceae cyanobacterium]